MWGVGAGAAAAAGPQGNGAGAGPSVTRVLTRREVCVGPTARGDEVPGEPDGAA